MRPERTVWTCQSQDSSDRDIAQSPQALEIEILRPTQMEDRLRPLNNQ